MADPTLVLTELLTRALDGADPVVRPSDRADYQANGLMGLAKRQGRNPRELAAEKLSAIESAVAGIATVEVAGAGFVNLTLTERFIESRIAEVADDAGLGVRPTTTPERVVVDYSAPNVAKEMHVGHLRSTVIGDAFVRLFERVGHTVLRENHVGDWGLAFGMLIEHLLEVGEAEGAAELSTGDLTGFYKQAREKFDASDDYKERARNRVVALQSGDPETLRLWKVLVDQSATYFQVVYDRLGVKLLPDDIVGESFYNPMLNGIVDDLAERGLLVESDGAQCVFPPGFTGREGDPQPLIIKNRNGGFGYAITDIATVRDRVERRGATLMLYVVGAPQAMHLSMVWKTCELAGWLVPPARAVHVPFGNVLGDDRKIYRTRSGDSVKLSDLLDEAIERAEAAIADKNPDIIGDERRHVADAVGIGAIKYADLANDRIKDYVFSFDRMLAFEGNTAPYLQYAHARIQSILRKAPEFEPGLPVSLTDPAERALAVALLAYDAAVNETIEKLSVHRLCTYLFDLAQRFTGFYEACPVLKDGVPADVRASRLSLCHLTARILADGLGLIGILAPERM